jgi:hypothetical protein
MFSVDQALQSDGFFEIPSATVKVMRTGNFCGAEGYEDGRWMELARFGISGAESSYS